LIDTDSELWDLPWEERASIYEADNTPIFHEAFNTGQFLITPKPYTDEYGTFKEDRKNHLTFVCSGVFVPPSITTFWRSYRETANRQYRSCTHNPVSKQFP
jgi:hypothetical protein